MQKLSTIYPLAILSQSLCRCGGASAWPWRLGGSPVYGGHRCRVPMSRRREIPVSEAATEPNLPRSRVRWLRGGSTVLGGHGEVRGVLICIPGESRPCLYGSGPGRAPIARLAEPPVTRTPRRYARHRARSAVRPNRGRGGHARSSPPQRACDGKPGSRRPPGGRVAAWDPTRRETLARRQAAPRVTTRPEPN